MNTKLFVGLAVLVLGAGVGWYVLKNDNVPAGDAKIRRAGLEQVSTPTPEFSSAVDREQTSITGALGGTDKGGGQAMEKATVSYTDNGFTPKSITVKQGTLVTFANNSSKGMWVASAVHPTHQVLPGFDELQSVQRGGTYDYTFTKAGTWQYHNHVGAGDIGTVAVTE